MDTLWIDNNDQLTHVEMTGVGELLPITRETPIDVPAEFAVCGPYPNPFNPITTFRLDLPDAGDIVLSVYDVSGRLVAARIDGIHQAGSYEVVFDASDLVSGVYLYRIDAGNFSASGKMVLLR